MAFKEGVTGEQVQQFRAFVKTVADLDAQVDSGLITPDEAFDKATAAIEGTPVIVTETTKERTTAPKKK